MKAPAVGSIVRPVISIAGLDPTRMYRVRHVEQPSPFDSLTYLEDAVNGFALLAPIERAHLVLEVVSTTVTTRPAPALFN